MTKTKTAKTVAAKTVATKSVVATKPAKPVLGLQAARQATARKLQQIVSAAPKAKPAKPATALQQTIDAANAKPAKRGKAKSLKGTLPETAFCERCNALPSTTTVPAEGGGERALCTPCADKDRAVFVGFLTDTLIPDLLQSDAKSLVADLRMGLRLVPRLDRLESFSVAGLWKVLHRSNWFVDYVGDVLAPDLDQSMPETAADFRRLAGIVAAQLKAVGKRT